MIHIHSDWYTVAMHVQYISQFTHTCAHSQLCLALPVHYKDHSSEEERAIADLDRRIREMEARISEQRKDMGG